MKKKIEKKKKNENENEEKDEEKNVLQECNNFSNLLTIRAHRPHLHTDEDLFLCFKHSRTTSTPPLSAHTVFSRGVSPTSRPTAKMNLYPLSAK